MAHFYVTLPSNSSIKYYPGNTLTRFTTRLENPISLTGNWEVGLVEIQYQHTWNNLDKGEGRVYYSQQYEKQKYVQNTLRIVPGHYATPAILVAVINDSISQFAETFNLSAYAQFEYSDITKRLTAKIPTGANINFSPPLCAMLGVGPRQNPIANNEDNLLLWRAANVCDINRGFSSMYVYCNLLEHVPVGDTKAPLLRIIHLTGTSGDSINTSYEKPYYVPLQQKNFDSIEIDIRSDTGLPVAFEYGKLIVTLHFRLSKNPYFLQ
jgi:hypothetical protein